MTDFYVRPLGGSYGTEDGTSYENAANGFTDVPWPSIQPGDTLYVAGTHNQKLNTQSVDGLPGLPITIRGDFAGDPGEIDGQNNLDFCIFHNVRDWYVYRDLILRNTGPDLPGTNFDIKASLNLELFNLTVTGSVWDGLKISNASDILLRDSTFDNNTRRGATISGVSGPCNNIRFQNLTGSVNGRRSFTLSGANDSRNVTNSGFHGCVSTNNGAGFQLGDNSDCYVINCDSSNETLQTNPEGPANGWNVEVTNALNLKAIGNNLVGSSNSEILYIKNGVLDTSDLKVHGNTLNGAVNDYAIYSQSNNLQNLSIRGNLIMNSLRGIRTFNNAGQVVAKNTFVNINEAVRAQEVITAGSNLSVRDNIFMHDSSTSSNGFILTAFSSGNVIDIDNNHYYAPSSAANVLARINGVSYTSADVTTLDSNATVPADISVVIDSQFEIVDINSSAFESGLDVAFDPDTVGTNGEPYSLTSNDVGCNPSKLGANHPVNLLW